jgi:diaminopimelate epimerase
VSGLALWRAHGLGNDYLVLEAGDPLEPALVRAICDRHRGVGADGILEPADPGGADHGVRIWNPDGSIAEKSGNGLRIYARWLVEVRGAAPSFAIWTGSERVTCAVETEGVRVQMGRFTLDPSRIPLRSDVPWVDHLHLGLSLTAVGLGNPHVVAWREEPLDSVPWREWGSRLSTDPLFPNRTNVQVARALDRHTAEARIWERGAGETLASGSSACAVASAGVATGRLDRGAIEIRMPGGSLQVRIDRDDSVELSGAVEVVGRFFVDDRWLARRRSS